MSTAWAIEPTGALVVGHVVVVATAAWPPRCGDELDGEVGGLLVGAVTGDRGAEVVHDHAGAVLGQLQRVGPADAVRPRR